jgi:hypothetical protein
LFRLFLAGGLDALQLLVSLEVGTLQAALNLGHAAQDGGLGFGGRFIGIAPGFESSGAHQFPLGDGGLVETKYCSAGFSGW